MMLRTLMHGRLARLVLLSAAVLALSGGPAYADVGGIHQRQRPDRGYQQQGCESQGWRWDQNSANCQQEQEAPQAPQPAPRIPDDGNSK
jgi:hypothetical protein